MGLDACHRCRGQPFSSVLATGWAPARPAAACGGPPITRLAAHELTSARVTRMIFPDLVVAASLQAITTGVTE